MSIAPRRWFAAFLLVLAVVAALPVGLTANLGFTPSTALEHTVVAGGAAYSAWLFAIAPAR